MHPQYTDINAIKQFQKTLMCLKYKLLDNRRYSKFGFGYYQEEHYNFQSIGHIDIYDDLKYAMLTLLC